MLKRSARGRKYSRIFPAAEFEKVFKEAGRLQEQEDKERRERLEDRRRKRAELRKKREEEEKIKRTTTQVDDFLFEIGFLRSLCRPLTAREPS